MRSLTISMPSLTIYEHNNFKKKQARLFARINNRIDLKIMNVVSFTKNGEFCPVISALNYSLPVLYNALMKQKQHVKKEISKKNKNKFSNRKKKFKAIFILLN